MTVPLVMADVRTLRLPNALVLPGLGLLAWGTVWALAAAGWVGLPDPDGGASSALSSSGWSDASAGMVGASVTGGLLLIGWMLGAVGMGDVKLGTWLGGLAGMMGVAGRPEALGHGAAAGAFVSIVLIGAEVAAGATSVVVRIPFGPPLLLAFWAAVLPAVTHPPPGSPPIGWSSG